MEAGYQQVAAGIPPAEAGRALGLGFRLHLTGLFPFASWL